MKAPSCMRQMLSDWLIHSTICLPCICVYFWHIFYLSTNYRFTDEKEACFSAQREASFLYLWRRKIWRACVDLLGIFVSVRIGTMFKIIAPRFDPRAEKTGRKQRRKAYLRVMEFCDKPALFSRKLAEGVPIESSHAWGHWFESSSLHQKSPESLDSGDFIS